MYIYIYIRNILCIYIYNSLYISISIRISVYIHLTSIVLIFLTGVPRLTTLAEPKRERNQEIHGVTEESSDVYIFSEMEPSSLGIIKAVRKLSLATLYHCDKPPSHKFPFILLGYGF